MALAPAVLMVFAAVFHVRREEPMLAAPNIVLGDLAAFVAYARLVLAPYI